MVLVFYSYFCCFRATDNEASKVFIILRYALLGGNNRNYCICVDGGANSDVYYIYYKLNTLLPTTFCIDFVRISPMSHRTTTAHPVVILV